MRSRLLIILLLLTFESSGQDETVRPFLTKVLNALKTEDFEKVKELVPTKETWDTFATMTARPLPDNFERDYLEECRLQFEKLFARGQKYDVDWRKFKVDAFDSERSNLHDSPVIRHTGRLILKHRKRIVTLNEVEIMELDSNFYLISIRSLTNGKVYTGKN